jgi:hypothetical protein
MAQDEVGQADLAHRALKQLQEVVKAPPLATYTEAKALLDEPLPLTLTFDVVSVTGEAALVFQHMEADAYFGASVFWTKRSGAFGGEEAMIEHWQARRDGGVRGIVEIVEEGS